MKPIAAANTAQTVDLTEWRRWFQQHRDDPELIAGCARLGRVLAGGSS